jgi:hypothetical protein
MLITDRLPFSKARVAGCANEFRVFVTHAVRNCFFADVFGRNSKQTFEGRIYALVDKLPWMRDSNSKKKFGSICPVELIARFFRTHPGPFPNRTSVRSLYARPVCVHHLSLPDISQIAAVYKLVSLPPRPSTVDCRVPSVVRSKYPRVNPRQVRCRTSTLD